MSESSVIPPIPVSPNPGTRISTSTAFTCRNCRWARTPAPTSMLRCIFLAMGFPTWRICRYKSFIGEAIAIETPKRPGEDLTVADLRRSGHSSRRHRPLSDRLGQAQSSPAFFEGEWPGLEPALVEELIRRGVKAMGGDIASADSPAAIAAGPPLTNSPGAPGCPSSKRSSIWIRW